MGLAGLLKRLFGAEDPATFESEQRSREERQAAAAEAQAARAEAEALARQFPHIPPHP